MKTILLSILLLLSFNGYSQFRNTTWGMGKEQVIKIEKERLVREEDNHLEYEFLVEDFSVELNYYFSNEDQL